MCFSCNIIGANQKVKLKFVDIKSIARSKLMGFFNNGIIVHQLNHQTNQEEKFQFGQFKDREIAYSRITALWKGRAPVEVWQCNKSIFSGTETELTKGEVFPRAQIESNLNNFNIDSHNAKSRRETMAGTSSFRRSTSLQNSVMKRIGFRGGRNTVAVMSDGEDTNMRPGSPGLLDSKAGGGAGSAGTTSIKLVREADSLLEETYIAE